MWTSHTLVKASVGKGTEGCHQMLLPIEALILEGLKLWIGSNVQSAACGCTADCTQLGIFYGFSRQHRCGWHGPCRHFLVCLL